LHLECVVRGIVDPRCEGGRAVCAPAGHSRLAPINDENLARRHEDAVTHYPRSWHLFHGPCRGFGRDLHAATVGQRRHVDLFSHLGGGARRRAAANQDLHLGEVVGTLEGQHDRCPGIWVVPRVLSKVGKRPDHLGTTTTKNTCYTPKPIKLQNTPIHYITGRRNSTSIYSSCMQDIL